MKLTINRDHFVAGLKEVQNIVGLRSSMSILNNVLLKTGENVLELTTTNLDIGISCKVKAQVVEGGAITLPVKKLLNIIRLLPNIQVEIETTSSNQAKITSGGSVFRVMGIGPEDFPSLPSLTKSNTITLRQSDLLNMIKSVSYAQSTDENRHILNGVYFKLNEGNFMLVATDGRRLGFVSKDVEVNSGYDGAFILPAKTTSEIERLLGLGEKVEITFSAKQVSFDLHVNQEGQEAGFVDRVHLISKVVDGNYPNYQQVIPSETIHRIKVDREHLLECLSRASLVTSEKSNSIKLRISKNLLEVLGSSSEFGESHESMAIEFDDNNVELSFNPQFLMDPLRAVSKDEVFFEFNDALSPGLFRTLDSFLCVVMPLRAN